MKFLLKTAVFKYISQGLTFILLVLCSVVNAQETPKDKKAFFQPNAGIPYTSYGKQFNPFYQERYVKRDYYNKGFPIHDFDIAKPTDGKGLIVFTNKYGDNLFVKNADWIQHEVDMYGYSRERLFEAGNAEMLLFRNGVFCYHGGFSVSEVLAFGWNIYSREDGQFELGLVGGDRSLYSIDLPEFNMSPQQNDTLEMEYRGDACLYIGQVKNNKANGFGYLVKSSEGTLKDFGFWSNGQSLNIKDVLQEQYNKNEIKTMDYKHKSMGFNGKTRTKTLTGYFDISAKNNTPYGWFSSTYAGDDYTAGFSGYYPDEDKPNMGFLESEKEGYGIHLITLPGDMTAASSLDPKILTYNPKTSRAPFAYAVKESGDGTFHWFMPGLRSNTVDYSRTVPALTFNWVAAKQIQLDAEAERQRRIGYIEKSRRLFDASPVKPGEIVSKNGSHYYVNTIDQYSECIQLVVFPINLSDREVEQINSGKSVRDGELRPSPWLVNTDYTYVEECNAYALSKSASTVCTECNGRGTEVSIYTEYTTVYTPQTTTTKRSGVYVDYTTTTTENKATGTNSQQKTNVSTCPKCNGSGLN